MSKCFCTKQVVLEEKGLNGFLLQWKTHLRISIQKLYYFFEQFHSKKVLLQKFHNSTILQKLLRRESTDDQKMQHVAD